MNNMIVYIYGLHHQIKKIKYFLSLRNNQFFFSVDFIKKRFSIWIPDTKAFISAFFFLQDKTMKQLLRWGDKQV